MEKEFYYLDEKEQKGPYSIDQLKLVALKPDTLVWAEGYDNWKPVKEINELKGLLKKTPPPPPLIDNSINPAVQIEKEDQDEKKVLVEDSDVKFWVSFKIFATVLLLIGLAALFVYLVANNKKQKLKKEIYSKIENILDGKTVVLDGIELLTEGELIETDYSNSPSLFGYSSQDWWQREKLYTIYKVSNGGFTIKQLTKQNDDGYDIEAHLSGDMGYKNPSGRYIEPEYYDWGWGERVKISGGYYSSNYRLPVRQCYSQAFEFFTTDDKKSPGAYTPGKYVDITNFPDIRNAYFYMDNTAPKEISSSKMFALSSWTSSDEHGANINTEDWAVYYTTYGKHYEIAENKAAINKDIFTYLGLTIGSILVILLVTFFAKPKFFRNLSLYGKRWKNTLYQEQIFFFEHSFFNKHIFTEIINDKVSKGVLKYTDKGSTINLSYPNKELFYKIEKIDQDNLILCSMKDKSNIGFRRIGAKELEEVKVDLNETNVIEINKSEPSVNEETNQ